MPPTDTLTVSLAERSYPITFGRGLEALLAELIAPHRKGHDNVFIVTDASVAREQAAWLAKLGGREPLAVPAGEASKSFRVLEAICEQLARERIDRRGLLVAFGGGVVGDLAGFAAASYLRGLDFIQVPTTLLAMVDSSVGGKTGINLAAGKNLVGAFWQPKAVLVDLDLLKTLPPREFSAGMAEVIKYGLLADASMWRQLLELPEPLSAAHPALAGIVRRCCEIKAGIVRDDERETSASGGRALLNLGHTFAHAIEAVAGYGTYLHGEAVAIGLVLAMRLSLRQPGFETTVTPEDLDDLCRLIERYRLPTDLRHAPKPLEVAALMAAMQRDKKVREGRLRFVLLESAGQAVTYDDVAADLVATLWREAGAV